MSDVTRLLSDLQHGDGNAAEKLLPLVYAELRQLARAKMAREQPGHTLQPTALVHEAWLRLGDGHFENRADFFGASNCPVCASEGITHRDLNAIEHPPSPFTTAPKSVRLRSGQGTQSHLSDAKLFTELGRMLGHRSTLIAGNNFKDSLDLPSTSLEPTDTR